MSINSNPEYVGEAFTMPTITIPFIVLKSILPPQRISVHRNYFKSTITVLRCSIFRFGYQAAIALFPFVV